MAELGQQAPSQPLLVDAPAMPPPEVVLPLPALLLPPELLALPPVPLAAPPVPPGGATMSSPHAAIPVTTQAPAAIRITVPYRIILLPPEITWTVRGSPGR